jgi:phenylacetate-coenzyme A ligase PaaK-like adenylate-forming protein
LKLPFFRRGFRLPVSAFRERTPDTKVQRLRFPLTMPARVALFETGFGVDGAIRVFAEQEIDALTAYVPEALVLPLQLALTLADQKLRDLIELPSLKTAIVVLTSFGDAPLENHHRDLIWRAFGVPIFEQARGWDGTVLARECEVHDGLHLDETAVSAEMDGADLVITQLTALDHPMIRAATGWTGEIVKEPCECGAETPRLRNLAPTKVKVRFAVA